ncbi:MAG TPA: hypothetical protein VNC50_10565, partial [Planctomycetia bacterium]|nr:hypothetical protein [Planctomycetia bacterium]
SSAAELAAMIADPATMKSHMATFVPLPDATTTDTASANADSTAADTEAAPTAGTEIQSSSEFKTTPRPASVFAGGVDDGTPAAEVWYVVWSKDMRLTLVETTAASIRKHLGSGKLQVHVTASRSPKGPFLPLGMIPEFKQAKRSIPTA